MLDWPIGISTGCFYKKPIFDCLEGIMANGFSMLEISSSQQHLNYHDKDEVNRAAKMLRDLGMEAYSFHAPFADDIDIAALDNQHYESSVDEILASVEAAAVLNTRYFLIHPGPSKEFNPSQGEYYQRMTRVSHAINKISRHCKKLGMVLVLENMLPHLLFSNPSDILWIIGSVSDMSLGTCLDTGHAFLSDDLYQIMYKLAGHMQMLHVHDNFGNHDDHLPPGKGRIDWKYLMKELAEARFKGGMIIELNSDDDNEKLLEDARHSRVFLRDVLKELELTIPPITEK